MSCVGRRMASSGIHIGEGGHCLVVGSWAWESWRTVASTSGRVLTVRPGRQAAEALASLVREMKDGDPFCEITVIVPSGYAALSLRYRLASGVLGPTAGAGRHGLFGMSLVPLNNFLARMAGSQLAVSARRPLAASTELAVVRSALLDDPGPFSSLSMSGAVVAEVRDALRQLRWCSEKSLSAVRAFNARLEHLVRLYERVRSRLAPLFYDEVDIADAAVARLAGGEAGGEGGVVVLYCLPKPPTRLTGLFDSLAGRLFVIDAAMDARDTGAMTTVVSCADPDEEVRMSVRHLCSRMEAGVALWQQAIFYPSSGPYPTIINQQLAAAGIPSCGPAGRTLDRTMPGRFLLGLLDLSLRGWRRDEVISWLGGSPVVAFDGGLPVPVGAWDALSTAAGVTEGAASWSDHLASYVAGIGGVATTGKPGSDTAGAGSAGSQRAGVSRARREGVLGVERLDEISEALRLSRFMQDLVRSVAAIPVRRSWRAACHEASELMKRLLDPASRRTDWPEQEQDAYQQVQQVLRAISDVDSVLGSPGSIESFRDVLACELRARVEHGARFGDGVFVGPLTASRGMDFEEVAVLGLVESYLPGQPATGSLLPDAVRHVTGGEIETHRDSFARLSEDLRSALASGAVGTTVLWPRNDPRQGRSNTVSRWLLAEVGRMTGREGVLSSDLPLLTKENPGVLASAGSSMHGFAGLVSGSSSLTNGPGEPSAGRGQAGRRDMGNDDRLLLSPASEWELDVAALLGWVQSGRDALSHWTVRSKPLARRSVLLSRARAGKQLTRFDGLVGPLDGGDSISGGLFSATSLESYAICPMRYLFAKVLAVKSQVHPEDVITISPLDRGSLVHDVLELYSRAQLSGSERSQQLLEELACQVMEAYRQRGLLGRGWVWQYERLLLLRDLRRFCTLDAESELELLAAELPFGMHGAEPVVVRLKSGREVSFRGRADRVDRRPDGSLVVTDYKTGSPDEVGGLTEDCVLRGTKLQLPLYALAAVARFGNERDMGNERDTAGNGEEGLEKPAVCSQYWFVSERGAFSRVGYVVDGRVLERFRDAVGAILEGIDAGMFPARPGAPGQSAPRAHCKSCEYDSVCVLDRERQWEAKRDDPRLAAYLELCGEDR